MLELEEVDGVVIRLVRRARVMEVTGANDYQALNEALDEAGVPTVGGTLTGSALTNLRLRRRIPRLVAPKTVDVDLVYEHFFNEGQSFDSPPGGFLSGEVRSNVNQVESNLDADGNTISVSHTYDSDHPKYGGQTKEQGGTIQFFQPERNLAIQGLKTTTHPWIMANRMVGAVNQTSWNGGDARTWMCVRASTRPLSLTGRYYMFYEFQYNQDTWDPTVVFIDPDTGKPPLNLVEGEGYKRIERAPAVRFEAVLGARLQGA